MYVHWQSDIDAYAELYNVQQCNDIMDDVIMG